MAIRTGARRPEEKARPTGAPSVLAIVVTHGGRKWLKDALVALAAQDYGHLDVLVVDDASPDSREQPHLKRVAKRHLRRLRWGYLRTPRPLGYGGAINWALSRVRTDADLLLFMHDDLALEKTSVSAMVARIAADPETAIVGPKIVAWEDPTQLEEVGMASDRFGYPYKGLEDDEIDLGQHDRSGEVFYVTSTCMLVRHDVFRQLRGWDSRMRAFSEDLDLCWRARLMGYSVRTEPKASGRHAIALATGQRDSPFRPTRYFIRRNRLRAVLKNVSGLRLLWLVPQFFVLALAEMFGFIALRQPGEIVHLGRGMVWNLGSFPQTFSERRKVQSRRKVTDRQLERHQVRQTTRIRAYVSNQRDRLEEGWGRRAELVARRGTQARQISTQLKGWIGFAIVLVVISLLLGFRHIWWSPSIAVGELLPYPERATALWRAFFAPWRGVGLGQPGPSSPALGLLGFFPLITLGAAGAAQKLLIFSLGLTAFAGGYLLVSDLVDRAGRFASGAAYMLGAVGYAGLREGALGALVFGAFAPFVLRAMMRLCGWSRPPGWRPGTAIARIGLASAISAAFVPGSLFLYLLAAILLSAARAFFVRGERAVRAFLGCAGGIAIGLLLCFPWATTWFSQGGALALMRGEDTWRTYASSFSDQGITSVLFGQTPETPVFFGIALSVLGLLAVIISSGQRKRFALALWSLIVATGIVMTLFKNGALRPLVASPIEAGVLASVAFAALAGLAVGAFRLDLPRRGFGWIHWASLAGFAAASFLVLAGLGPALLKGEWDPTSASGRENAKVVEQVSALLQAEAQGVGQFRSLWVGRGWLSPEPTSARPAEDAFVTGPRGQVLSDLFERPDPEARSQLDRVLSSIESGATDRGGYLLGTFNIHYVILEREDANEAWLSQRDLGIVRSEDTYVLLENEGFLRRAATYDALPARVEAVSNGDPLVTTGPRERELETLTEKTSYSYVDDQVRGPGNVFIAESEDASWRATLDGEPLDRAEGGWGNAFVLPESRGRLEVENPRTFASLGLLILVLLAWAVVLAASFPRKVRDRRRTPRT